ncbi:MAG: cell envelope integrity protein TolA [Betaproteobacteria bacterium]|nr:cell envelope integrity protein TolA [Betaproteobacteria bacterium]
MNWTADRDEPGKITSGVLAVVVHIAFFALLVLGVSWQHRAPATVEVELWNNLPPLPQAKTPPPPPPKIEPKPEVKPQPPQPKVEVKPAPEPKPVAKPDIVLEKEKQEKALREHEERERERQKAEALKREQLAKAEAIKREQIAKAEAKKREDAEKQKLAALERDRREKQDQIEKLRRDQEKAVEALRQQQASAQAKMVDEYKRRISDKIRRYVVKDPCASLGNPEIVFEAILLPDGNTLQPPRIKRSSGSAACDDAVLRAVIRAQPLPLPPDPVLMAQFRELNLNFRPNE